MFLWASNKILIWGEPISVMAVESLWFKDGLDSYPFVRRSAAYLKNIKSSLAAALTAAEQINPCNSLVKNSGLFFYAIKLLVMSAGASRDC